ncbi:HNH endonuclease signature motif containing protein [Microbacterium protaetiae]|uniref:HNH endonuclease signature motif containing protein n=1 Tax=Microbacterium protaetiae TaxID=2509458 RepID=UPI0013EBFAB5|nr:HNH endonuclease signature motif containing protein [Microbacterium protaetiae]
MDVVIRMNIRYCGAIRSKSPQRRSPMSALTDVSPVHSDLDELLDDLVQSRSLAGRAFAAEMFFFARVADLVDRREAERAAREGRDAITHSTQLGMREVYAEIGAELYISEWQVARKVSLASTMLGSFYETLCEASCGQISGDHATLIADSGIVIDDGAVRMEYEAVALDMAREMTPAQLKSALDGLVGRLDPEGTQARVREAAQRRKVTVRTLEPGLVRVTADVPTVPGVGSVNRLRQAAVTLFDQNAAESEAAGDGDLEAAGQSVVDDRTVAQIMADMFCDLLLTAEFSGHGTTDEARDALSMIRPSVQVTIPAATVTGARVGGAVVDGFGPIDDQAAQQLAGNAPAWTRVFTDPCTGVPVCVDRYRPSKKQRRYLQARDQQCRFPGCRRRAQKCDIDHTVAHAEGGATCLCNLEHLCKRHHTVKHDTAWRVRQLSGGILIWTAPTGRSHPSRPPGTVRFDPIGLIDPDPHFRDGLAAHDPAPF